MNFALALAIRASRRTPAALEHREVEKLMAGCSALSVASQVVRAHLHP
jgi:hypothetical protein